MAHNSTTAKAAHSADAPAQRRSADCISSERAGEVLLLWLMGRDSLGKFMAVCWYIDATELQ
ncbi:MAG: hypothetical protein U1D25_04265 [Hydrogenophaga sp.]|nr:hypothetical protein [Hydrogenophaga sp.]